MIAALAFVQPINSKLILNNTVIMCGTFQNDDCDKIIDYFEDTYIGRFRQNAPRRAPLFAQALWNMFHRTFNEVARINNSIQGWQRSFQATVGPSHPSVWKFMEKLIQGLGRHLANLLQVLGGHLAPRVGRQSFNPNQRLIRILDNIQTQTQCNI